MYLLGKFKKKRIRYTIIPKYFKNINYEDNRLNIKVIYWRLNC